jgi:hypothetical protein
MKKRIEDNSYTLQNFLIEYLIPFVKLLLNVWNNLKYFNINTLDKGIRSDINRTIKSVQDQDYKNFEHVILYEKTI